MTVAYISEYAEVAKDKNGHIIQSGKEPAVATQTVSFTTSNASEAFNARTRFIRIIIGTTSNAGAHFSFGASPTATTSSPFILEQVAEYFGVLPGQKVALIDSA